jgi:para-nitrobenzyl esterase
LIVRAERCWWTDEVKRVNAVHPGSRCVITTGRVARSQRRVNHANLRPICGRGAAPSRDPLVHLNLSSRPTTQHRRRVQLMGIGQLLRTGIGRRPGARFCAGAIALGTVLAAASAAGVSTAATHGNGGATPVVTIMDGAVRGKTTGATDEFLGIPYAAPPVGSLRWRPPQPAARWSGERDVTTFAPHCAQPATPFGAASSSEDCLYLNVFVPAGRKHGGKGHPVMVWIHGGGLLIGESDDYHPAQLAADGTVVVTINYRLGALGFLAHPALAEQPGGSTGAYGLMDQQAALRWVQRNIRAFGGNPRKVTIAGESAGGLSVMAHVASPAAHGLFARAIVQSGSFLTQTPLAAAETAGEAFAAKAGCASQSAACLRGLPVSIIQANENPSLFGYVPGVVDGEVLKQSIGTALDSGQFNRVPIINGTNHDEARLLTAVSELQGAPVTAANYQAMMASTLGVSADVAAVVATEYPLSAYPSPAVALSAAGTDALFACPALALDKLASKFVPTFAYEFNDDNAPQRYLPPVSFPYGAPHASELQYLFDLPTAPIAGALTAQQQRLAASMQHYWAHFAARGLPSSPGEPPWPGFNSHSQKMLSLVPPRPHVETDFAAAHHCAFWAQAG